MCLYLALSTHQEGKFLKNRFCHLLFLAIAISFLATYLSNFYLLLHTYMIILNLSKSTASKTSIANCNVMISLQICLPENPPWYELLDCSRDQCEEISKTILNFYCIPRPNAEKLDRVINAAKEAYELKKSFNEKSKRDLKEVKKQESASNFSPLDPSKNKDSPHKPKLSPGSLINNKLTKLAENGSSESHKNGGVRRSKHHSPRRRYSPVSPPRRKHDRYGRKKRRSSSDSESSSAVRKRKHRSKRRVSTSSDDSSSSSDSEVGGFRFL